MPKLAEFSRLLQDLYDTALDDSGWHTLADRIAAAFDTHSCTVQVRQGDKTELLGVTGNVTPALVQEYEAHYHTTDLWAQALMARGLDKIFVSAELVENRVLMRTEHYDYLKKVDTLSAIGGAMSIGADGLGMIGVHSSSRTLPFDAESRSKMALLLPHLQRALKMRSMFQEQAIQRGMASSALDQLPDAVLLTDNRGKLLYTNRAAEALLQARSGLSAHQGYLQADTPWLAEALLHHICNACRPALDTPDAFPCARMSLPRQDRTPLALTIVPMRAGDLNVARAAPMAMLTAQSGEDRAPRPQRLQILFKLSQAEAQLACSLAQGLDLKEIAAQRGVSLSTVRSQIKSVLHKTGTRRQGELIALVHMHGAAPQGERKT